MNLQIYPNFFTPAVSERKASIKHFGDLAERYFDIGHSRYKINEIGEVLKKEEQPSSWIYTALKIASFFTIILPLIMLIAKCVYRSQQSFYDLNKYNLQDVISKIQSYTSQGKKIALMVGRTAMEILPHEENTVWVSLDESLTNCGPKDWLNTRKITPDRLHLNMSFNDRDQMSSIKGLFDKVVIDGSVWKFIDERVDPLRLFHAILKNNPQSEFIVPATISARTFLMVEKTHYCISGHITVPFSKIAKKHDVEDEDNYRKRFKQELDKLFLNVKGHENEPYPYKTRWNERFYFSANPKNLTKD
jgi:hypothetical protein